MEVMMNREQFMRQLECLLQNISPTERAEALQYYNDYFDDAGVENEQAVIEALGSPAKVAENIKRDLYGGGYADNMYQREVNRNHNVSTYTQPNRQNTQTQQKGKLPTWAVVLIVIGCVVLAPAWIPALIGAASFLLGLIVTWFSLIFGFGVASIVLFLIAIVLVIIGIPGLAGSVPTGLLLLGIALLIAGIGVLFLMLTVAMAGIATPAMIRGITALCRKLFGKQAV